MHINTTPRVSCILRLDSLNDFGSMASLDDFRDVDFESQPRNTLWEFTISVDRANSKARFQESREMGSRIAEFPQVRERGLEACASSSSSSSSSPSLLLNAAALAPRSALYR